MTRSISTIVSQKNAHGWCSPNRGMGIPLTISELVFIYEKVSMFVLCTHPLVVSIHNSLPNSHGLQLCKLKDGVVS